MPVRNDPSALRTALLSAIQSPSFDPKEGKAVPGLSGNEVDKVLRSLKEDGVTPEEAKAVVDTLVEALKTGYDATGPREQKGIARLLDTVEKMVPGTVAEKQQFTSNGAVSWLSLLQARASGSSPTPTPTPVTPTPTPVITASTLPKAGFAGEAVAIGADGGLQVAGVAVDFDLKSITQGTALLGLMKAGQLDGLGDAHKKALATNLTKGLVAGLPLDQAAANKFQASMATVSALGALGALGAHLSASDVDALAGLVGKLPSNTMEALLLRALKGAPATPAATKALEGFPSADQTQLLKSVDSFRLENGRVAYTAVTGEAAAVALACTSFAKDPSGLENIAKGLEAWSQMTNGDGLSGAEAQQAFKMLEPYVNGASTTNLVFGSFAAGAPKAVAENMNAATIAKVTPQLDGARPAIAGVPLTTSQAAMIKTLLPGIKDDATVASLGKALAQAHGALQGSMSAWGTPAPPTSPLSAAAFGAFARAAVASFEARAGTTDGMMDARALETNVKAEAKALGDTITPVLSSLAQGVLREGGTTVQVSPAAAQVIKDLLNNNAKSTMSAPNIVAAAVVVAQHHGGRLEGAGATAFADIVKGYRAEYPGVELLDFNKLGRIASFAVEGKAVPLSTLNGKSVKLAEFYTAVATSVADSIKTDLRHPWAAQRWGLRAKDSVELLDVIAQKTAEGAGPIVALKQQFPGQAISVVATGKDGEHERFLYKVGSKVFAEASDGRLDAYDVRKNGLEPVLFTANVRDDGAFDVAIPATTQVRKYPTQGTYAVGDSVDIAYRDHQAANAYDEGKPFSTQFKVLHGTIKAFDASGKYEVEFKDPTGATQTKQVQIDELKKYNHPHYFSETTSTFSDVQININTDKVLKDFLEGADPIIKQHLPTDGSLLSLSTGELAKRQKKCVEALMEYAKAGMKYPADKTASHDAESKRYHELIDGAGYYSKVDLGELVKIKKGVCRHQCILQHLLLQRAGVDSRLASGSANTSSGGFRGFHIWVELTLSDNARYLSDQTWDDPFIPLWDGAYDVDKQRTEMYDRTSRYDGQLADG